MRTQQEIEAEIAKLEKLKEQIAKVAPTTFFGDSNVAAIEAQIEVLKNEDVDSDYCYTKEENGEWTERQRESGQEALDWLEGDSEQLADDPGGWLSIIKNASKR